MPCKDCEKHTPGCHSTCEEYIQFRKERDEMLNKKREESRILWNEAFDRNRAKRMIRDRYGRRKR